MLTDVQTSSSAVDTPVAPPRRTVLVGVDGSDAAGAALAWAVGEAGRSGGRLRVVHVRQPAEYVLTLRSGRHAGVPSTDGERQLRAAGTSLDLVPVEMDKVVLEGSPPAVLVAESATVDLLVLGAEGLDRHRGLLLGEVVGHCVRYSACPVVVVPAPDRSAR